MANPGYSAAAAEDWAALDWENMGIDWTSAWAEGQKKTSVAAAPASTPTHTVAPIIAAEAKSTSAPAPSSNPVSAAKGVSSSSSSSSGTAALWKGIKGIANDIKSFGTAVDGGGSIVGAIGNIGSPQGSNMIMVDSTKGYAFTLTIKNTSKKPMTVALWNKAFSRTGEVADADPNLGSCVAPVTPILSIALNPNEQQVVAMQDGTLMGWSEAVDETIFSGAFATTWGEGKFTTAEASGYDVSAIVNPAGSTYLMSISNTLNDCISSQSENYWIAEDGNPEKPVAVGSQDGSCYVPGKSAHVTVEMGGPM